MRRDYHDPVYASWRKQVYERDSYECQMPGCNSKRKRLNAHHIIRWADAPHLRYDLNNGITLCWKCHKEVTGAERNYASLFWDILRNNEK